MGYLVRRMWMMVIALVMGAGAGADAAPVAATIRVSQGERTVGQIGGAAAAFDIGANADYLVRASVGEKFVEQRVHLGSDGDAAVSLVLGDAVDAKAGQPAAPAGVGVEAGHGPIEQLEGWLAKPRSERGELKEQPFAGVPISKEQAARAKRLLWDDHAVNLRATREAEWKENKVVASGKEMKFLRKNFGTKPEGGWNLYISMHGGGNAPAKTNDSQWQNQIKLYEPPDSLYISPRAPTNTWNLWHEPHIDALFDQLIQEAIVLEGVNPNRVYIMGYSAGGDGVYQLAPRMADRLAAAAMMAGHPNDASPLGLRNIGFTIHVGALDAAYKRNEVAEKWKGLLAELQKADSDGYRHEVQLHAGRSHWMNKEDAVALAWMAKFTRDPLPRKVVWKQASVTHERFYWLAVPRGEAKAGQEIVVRREGQRFEIVKAEGVRVLTILLNDEMCDLDSPVTVTVEGRSVFEGVVPRSIGGIGQTLGVRGDPGLVFSGRVQVEAGPP